MANICWIIKKSKRIPEKTSTSVLLTMLKPLCGLQQTMENSERDGNTLPASWETCMQVKKIQNWLDMTKQTSSKLGREYIKVVYCHRASVQFSRSVVSDSLRLHELQHARPPCPSSQWCQPAISSSGIPFSYCPQSLPASESFPMKQGKD